MTRSDRLSLPPIRRAARPREGDTFESLAARELPELESEEAVARLAAWNPHLGRLFGSAGRPLLVSDLVYLEPPPA